jgi:hypothetical protein
MTRKDETQPDLDSLDVNVINIKSHVIFSLRENSGGKSNTRRGKKTRKDLTTHNNKGQRHHNTTQDKTRQDRRRHDKTWREKRREGKGREEKSKTEEDKTRRGERREEKRRGEKRRERREEERREKKRKEDTIR